MKTTIKYLIAATSVLLSCTALQAQSITGGIEAEVVTSSVKISDIDNSFISVVNGDNIMGYAGGIFMQVNAGPFYVKPKLLVCYQSGDMQLVYPDYHSENVSFHVTKLDIPLLFGLKVIGPVSIEAGPVYSRIISVTKVFNENNVDVRPGGLGYRFGVNAQLGIIGFNVSYQGVKHNSGGSGNVSSYQSPNQLIFGVSVSFGKQE